MNQSRWQSKTAWLALITLVAFVLKTYFKIEIAELDRLIELTFVVVTAFGIFNNPKDGSGY